jgi:hypothetical protein
VSCRDLLTGVVAGVVATTVWALLVFPAYQWLRRRRNFQHLAGAYHVTRKSTSKVEPETVSITVHGNVLEVEYEGLVASDGTPSAASGKIAMNEQLPSSGRGHYWQDTPGRARGWGFYEVQLVGDGTILVHSTFSDTSERAVLVGYQWDLIEAD